MEGGVVTKNTQFNWLKNMLEKINWFSEVGSFVQIFSLNQKQYNQNHNVPENHPFSTFSEKWAAISTKHRWTEEGYDNIFCLCVALTNFHVSYNLYNDCNYVIGNKIAQKCKASLKNFE